jgi:hypothetical protein
LGCALPTEKYSNGNTKNEEETTNCGDSMEIVSLNRMFPCRKKNYYCYMVPIQPMKHLMSLKNKSWVGGISAPLMKKDSVPEKQAMKVTTSLKTEARLQRKKMLGSRIYCFIELVLQVYISTKNLPLATLKY